MIATLALLLASQNSSFGIHLAAPISTWDEALPLGNGEVGALVWGEDQTLRVSLDRGDLWDLRPAPEVSERGYTYQNLAKLAAAGDAEEISRLFDQPYDRLTPTKLPGFRLEMQLTPDDKPTSFDLSYQTGVASVKTTKGNTEFVFDRNMPVLVGESDAPIGAFQFVPPKVLSKLGYPAAETGPGQFEKRGDLWISQVNKEGLQYVACLASKKKGAMVEFAVSFVTNAHDIDPLKYAHKLADSALKRGFMKTAAASTAWWKSYWSVSHVQVPDQPIQKQYDLAMYLYGSGARRGQPPIPLQGLWTADEGGLPPWKGDYHHDLNTQLIYWPYLASGHLEQGRGLLDFLWDQLPVYEEYAVDFFGVPDLRTPHSQLNPPPKPKPGPKPKRGSTPAPAKSAPTDPMAKIQGAAIPGVAALDGTPLGGWPMYSNSVTMGPWLSLAFVDYWHVTQDSAFLRNRAYPFCRELAVCVESLLHPDAKGRLVLTLSSSPEIHDNELKAFETPLTNFDLSVLKAFFKDLAEMAEALKKPEEAARWSKLDKQLGDLWLDDTGFKVSSDEDLTESHRHLSHLMAIYPLELVSVDGDQKEQKAITDSLAHLEKLGTKQWCGYSFAWAACLYARCRKPTEALKNLSIYASAFVLRNGFHANGDQSGKGYSDFTYRPFTLEGNFAAAQAVHEMLLQSSGGVIQLFPATPWDECSFDNLRTNGGFLVSAKRSKGKLESASIKATSAGHLVVKTEGMTSWQTPSGPVQTKRLEINLKAGQVVSVN